MQSPGSRCPLAPDKRSWATLNLRTCQLLDIFVSMHACIPIVSLAIKGLFVQVERKEHSAVAARLDLSCCRTLPSVSVRRGESFPLINPGWSIRSIGQSRDARMKSPHVQKRCNISSAPDCRLRSQLIKGHDSAQSATGLTEPQRGTEWRIRMRARITQFLPAVT